jgi:hypothetical protein
MSGVARVPTLDRHLPLRPFGFGFKSSNQSFLPYLVTQTSQSPPELRIRATLAKCDGVFAPVWKLPNHSLRRLSVAPDQQRSIRGPTPRRETIHKLCAVHEILGPALYQLTFAQPMKHQGPYVSQIREAGWFADK